MLYTKVLFLKHYTRINLYTKVFSYLKLWIGCGLLTRAAGTTLWNARSCKEWTGCPTWTTPIAAQAFYPERATSVRKRASKAQHMRMLRTPVFIEQKRYFREHHIFIIIKPGSLPHRILRIGEMFVL